MCRLLSILALLLLFTAPAALAGERGELRDSLAAATRAAGPDSGVYVRDAGEDEVLFRKRADERRTLASNTKLFTTAALLDAFPASERLVTTVLAERSVERSGILRGDLYLRGGGDPTFGSASLARRSDSEATAGALAREVERAGVSRVRGRVIGDESLFDSLRGGPASGFSTSRFVGPLSALTYDRGLDGGGGFQSDPPVFAAAKLERALEKRGVEVRGRSRRGTAPNRADELAGVESPTVAKLVELTNKPSDNLAAELLAKGLGVRAADEGSTEAGAGAATRYARDLDARARLVDGSGLSRANRAAPEDVGKLLLGLRAEPHFEPFLHSLPVAGRDGTLSGRMREGPARGRCSAKTGTLPGVSALSGYCTSKGGDSLVFSFLMKGVDVSRARDLQDRMTNALARYRG